EHQTTRTAAADTNVIRAGGERIERVVFKRAGGKHADLAGTECGDIQRLTVGCDRHLERHRQTVILNVRIETRRPGELGVVDVFVQVARGYAACRNDADASLRQMTLHRMSGEQSR